MRKGAMAYNEPKRMSARGPQTGARTAGPWGPARAQRAEADGELFELLVRGVTDYAIFLLDAEGRVASWNEGAERINGYRAEEAIGLPLSAFYPARSAPRAQAALGRARDSGRVAEECWHLRKDGTRFWAESSLCALYGEGGALRGYARVTRDATERRQRLLAMRAQAAELTRANEELSQFAHVISHDLQAPLRKITAFGEALRDRLGADLAPEAADCLERMRRAAGHMGELIDDLLRLTRVSESGRPHERVDLERVVDEVVNETVERGSDARVRRGSLPAVHGDAVLLRQLFQNLLGNALKFRRPQSPPRVLVVGRRLDRGLVEIAVRDNGIGFEERHFERILQPFQRLHTRAEFPGTGMGLAICRRIVLRHGGRISARSRPGIGSILYVVLPAEGGA